MRKGTEAGLKAMTRAQALVEGGSARLKAAAARIDETLSKTDRARPREPDRRSGDG